MFVMVLSLLWHSSALCFSSLLLQFRVTCARFLPYIDPEPDTDKGCPFRCCCC